MLAFLYIGYIIALAKWRPELMPPLSAEGRVVELPAYAKTLAAGGSNALSGLFRAAGGGARVPARTALGQLFVSLLPALALGAILALTYYVATSPDEKTDVAGLTIDTGSSTAEERVSSGLATPDEEKGEEKPEQLGVAPGTGETEKPEAKSESAKPAVSAKAAEAPKTAKAADAAPAERLPIPGWYWIVFGICVAIVAVLAWLWTSELLEVFKMLLGSFFPLALLILMVLGSIVFGLSTPTEAAAVGAFGGCILAVIYRYITHWKAAKAGQESGSTVWTTVKELGVIVRESSFLTAKTSAMVCWLFIGSRIFSPAFALLGRQEMVVQLGVSLVPQPPSILML